MTRLVMLMVAVVAFGCATKPSEDECRKAIANMQTLMGTEHLSDDQMVESQVRRCKGGSTKKSVQCAINAKTIDDLRACDFYKVPDNAKGIGATPDTTGSAAGSANAGSAGEGSADAGSAGEGSAGADGAGAGSAGAGSASAGADATGAGSAGAGAAGAGSAGADSAGTGSASATN